MNGLIWWEWLMIVLVILRFLFLEFFIVEGNFFKYLERFYLLYEIKLGLKYC